VFYLMTIHWLLRNIYRNYRDTMTHAYKRQLRTSIIHYYHALGCFYEYSQYKRRPEDRCMHNVLQSAVFVETFCS